MMKNKDIINIGKTVFGCSFLIGNICLFGFLVTKKSEFAMGGYLMLIFGSLFNLLVIIGLLIYGLFYQSMLKACMKSSMIILINIPMAILYAFIGLTNLV